MKKRVLLLNCIQIFILVLAGCTPTLNGDDTGLDTEISADEHNFDAGSDDEISADEHNFDAGTDEENNTEANVNEALPSEEATETEASTDEQASLHFIDVGQGDCTLICSGGHYMLIDAGPDDYGTRIQLYLKKQGVDKLDYLVLTHPDSDHIGSADVIITKYDIDHILMSPYTKENDTYKALTQALEYKNYTAEIPKAGENFKLGNVDVEILQNDLCSTPNDSSIVLMLTCGQNKFLFTGDCEEESENSLLSAGYDLSADLYQVGHHGSATSSSEKLLEAVSPTYAVISCGADNTYGHPHQEVLDRFKERGILIYRLDEQGSVVASTDGTSISLSSAPSENYRGGSSELELAGKQAYGLYVTPDTEEIPPYIGNKRNSKLHRSTCDGLPQPQNQVYFDTLTEAEAAGFGEDNQCKRCRPYDQ